MLRVGHSILQRNLAAAMRIFDLSGRTLVSQVSHKSKSVYHVQKNPYRKIIASNSIHLLVSQNSRSYDTRPTCRRWSHHLPEIFVLDNTWYFFLYLSRFVLVMQIQPKDKRHDDTSSSETRQSNATITILRPIVSRKEVWAMNVRRITKHVDHGVSDGTLCPGSWDCACDPCLNDVEGRVWTSTHEEHASASDSGSALHNDHDIADDIHCERPHDEIGASSGSLCNQWVSEGCKET